jgi:hypothetical protein
MKCPKCSYISFDHNEVCPKCNKDIGAEQRRMNHPTYKPSPPFLLGSLLGEADQTEDSVFDEGQSLDLGLEIRGIEEAEKPVESVVPPELAGADLLDDVESEDLEPIANFELEEEAKEASQESGDFSLDVFESPSTHSGTVDEEEAISLNLDEPSVVGPISEKEPPVESSTEQDEALGIDIDDLSLDEIEVPAPNAVKKTSFDEAEMVTLVIDKKEPKDSQGLEDTELELDLEEFEDE